MKKSKWLKWQIGAVGALGVAILFQQVKDSQAFALAAEKTNPDSSRGPAAQEDQRQDPVLKEWAGSGTDSGNDDFGSGRRGNRKHSPASSFGGSSSDGNGSGGQQWNSSDGSSSAQRNHTRSRSS